jgi:serine/threonine protein kinase
LTAPLANRVREALDAQYDIIRELGLGGTSVVYLARKRETGEDVAIKVIRATYLEDAEALARFAREAELATRLDHPNIVPVRDVLPLGGGAVALVMQYVAGQTLRAMIQKEGPLSTTRTEEILRDISAALDAAHGQHIVHRDVKPENVFVSDTGRALLADFGLARSMSHETQITMSGVAIGTPTYMPPEQIDGGTTDARGDIYSLGLVGWEMLSGRRPWEGDSLYALLYHQKHDRLPDVRELRTDVSDTLAGTIATALEKDPALRWQSIDDMLAALDGRVQSRPQEPLTVSPSDTVRFERANARRMTPPPIVTPTNVPREQRGDVPVRPTRRIVPMVAAAAIVIAAALWGMRIHSLLNPAPPTPARPFATNTGDVAIAPAATPASRRFDTSIVKSSGDTAATRPLVTQSVPSRALAQANTMKTSKAPSTPSSAAQTSATPGTASPVMETAATSVPATAELRTSIVTGGMHTCLIDVRARAYCWGANDRGQLGGSARARSTTPIAMAGVADFTTMTAGLWHTCALTRDGIAECWGDNDHGQLGDRSVASHAAPVRVADSHVFTAISAGASHTCALTSDRTAWCWGAGSRGQLGNDAFKDSNIPVRVANIRFSTIAVGWDFACGIDENGRAWCWGDNDGGRLGTGDTTARAVPAVVSTDQRFTSIATGSSHACALTTSGAAYCWGQDSNGQLGDGTTSTRNSPVRVKSASHFVSLTTGAVHTCGLDASGTAFCWGLDSYGQLGDGGGGPQSAPVRVAGNHTFTAIHAFGSHTCGTTIGGDAFCWGYNLEGQLGDGTRVNRSRPVYVESPSAR